MEKITIFIAEDHTLIREAWHILLNADHRFKVLAAASNGEEAIEQIKQLRPNVAIMDINLPGINGIEATYLVRKYSPGTKVLCVSMHTQPVYVRKMIKQGATGYVTKSSPHDELCKAVVEVHNNRRYLCEEVKNILTKHILDEENEQDGFNSLSEREIEIIGLLKKGYSSKEIAEPLNISVKTVDVHRYNILKKLNLRNTAAMVDYINKTYEGI
jgi:two-component system invasion response regulator UvrY